MSAAQTCLEMQKEQHTLEMVILHLRKNNIVQEQQKSCNIWSRPKNSLLNNTQDGSLKRISRQKK